MEEKHLHCEKVDTEGEDATVCPYCGYCNEFTHEHMVEAIGDKGSIAVPCTWCGQEYRLMLNTIFTTERMEEAK